MILKRFFNELATTVQAADSAVFAAVLHLSIYCVHNQLFLIFTQNMYTCLHFNKRGGSLLHPPRPSPFSLPPKIHSIPPVYVNTLGKAGILGVFTTNIHLSSKKVLNITQTMH